MTLLGDLTGFLVEFLPMNQSLLIPDFGVIRLHRRFDRIHLFICRSSGYHICSEAWNFDELLKSAFSIHISNECVNSVYFSQPF